MNSAEHYDAGYFSWQERIGRFGGWANEDKFKEYITKDARVLDFGCGGGYLLARLDCREKIGIEINDAAIQKAREAGLLVYKTTAEVSDEWADVVISDNALEHTTHPLNELKELHKKLKPGGKIVFVVPCESVTYKYHSGDINYHLYSWSPMAIGNLFNEAGFNVLESLPYIHKWPPRYETIARIFGRRIFNLACRIYGRWEKSWYQVRIVAQRPQI